MKLERGGPWIETGGPDNDVVVSSRARLARNLVGFPFVNQASGDQCTEILRLVKSLDLSDHSMQWLDVADLEHAETDSLMVAEGDEDEEEKEDAQAAEAEAGGAAKDAKSERKSLSSRMSLKKS